MARTPEEGHTPKCLAQAMICAIENYRDEVIRVMGDEGGNDSSLAQFDFRIWAQNNDALHWADEYLADGTATCICPDKE